MRHFEVIIKHCGWVLKALSSFSWLSLLIADRAKQIKTKAVVNEDPTDKLIRELKEQNEKLKAQLAGGKIDMTDIDAMAKRENLSKEEIGNVQFLLTLLQFCTLDGVFEFSDFLAEFQKNLLQIFFS